MENAVTELIIDRESLKSVGIWISRHVPYLCRPKRASTKSMKAGIHPDNYRLVVFKDMSNEYAFLSRSAASTKETIKWEDGNEYPLVKVEVSHKSHPFYTGKAQFVDTAGRIDKFRQKYGKFDKKGGDKQEG